jgi:dTDP-glucose 4,6-dehydratase
LSNHILVTGGAGFIGSNFVNYLIENELYRDKKIVVLDKLTYAGDLDNLSTSLDNPRVTFIHGDVNDALLIDKLVRDSHTIVHFAAETHVTRSLHDSRTFVQTDILGTHNILSAIAKYIDNVFSFIHISTSEVYGTAISETMKESHPLNPLSPYAAAKCGADRMVHSFVASFDVPAFIVRPFNNYGPHQHTEKLIARTITSILQGEDITLHGSGGASRDWVFVRDTCKFISELMLRNPRLLSRNQRVINFGSGVSTSVSEIAELTLKLMGKVPYTGKIVKIKDRPGQVDCHRANASYAVNLKLPAAHTTLHEGLKLTINWYKVNQDWWKKRESNKRIEIVLPNGEIIEH